MIIFVHTPKCGGKSLKESLIEAYGKGIRLDYANPLDTSLLAPLLHIGTYVKGRPFEKYEVVYGHFSFDRHKNILKKNKTAMFFRDPIDLVCSYYFYLREKYPDKNWGDIVTFAKEKKLEHFYKKFLGELPVSELDIIGIVEEYEK
ncbi:MAG: hypothetical protein GY852_05100, partial [bacterium]|nr:hypothetical protein [bacterium]